MSSRIIKAEYIWLDGYDVQNLRSKTKIIKTEYTNSSTPLINPPMWNFDGSSTKQAKGRNSDCLLQPVKTIPNPLDKEFIINNTNIENRLESYLVLCEVFNADGSPHPTNSRHKLQSLENDHQNDEWWFAIEQEYTLYNRDSSYMPYNWPPEPNPQGRYYCGVGGDVIRGRPIVEEHAFTCLEAGLNISGTNAEVMLSQWEFQIGPSSPTDTADQLWLARFLLNRIAERHKAAVSTNPKPVKGDWNGSGAHINFSSKQMREKITKEDIENICSRLEENHINDMLSFGQDNHERMTGIHETCRYDSFKWGISDRGASIRVPANTVINGKGYLEDRRPAANMNPYNAIHAIMKSVTKET